MGRNKIKLEKQPAKSLHVRYAKRQPGIAKKARELGILCDTDVLLITCSTKGKQHLTLAPKSKFEEIVMMYVNMSSEERHQRKLESLRLLKKSIPENEHEVNVEELMNLGNPQKPSPPPNKINVSKEIEQAEEILHQIEGAHKFDMLNKTAELDYTEMLAICLLNINRQMQGANNTIPTPAAAGGNQVAMNDPMGSGDNGVLRFRIPPPNIGNANVFDASASTSTAAPPMAMREETMVLMDPHPLVNSPMFNDIGTSDMYFCPSTSASEPLMAMSAMEDYLLNAPICDVDDTNFGMGNDNGLARGGGNAGAA